MIEDRGKQLFNYLLLAILAMVYISGFFIDVTRDAAKYAYISKEIIQTNNWINLQILGEPYNQKPQLMFWLSAISFKLFGVSNFTFKLPIVLYSLLGLFFTYRLGKSTYGKKIGQLATVMVAFSAIFILYNQDLHTDIVLYTNSAFALWQFFEYLKNRKNKNLIWGGIALGLCLLSKGPFGVLAPLIAVTSYCIFRKDWKLLFNPKWIIPVLIAFAVATPAFYQMYHSWGIEGISFFFLGNTVGRFTGSYLGHTPDPTFYIHNLAYLLLPWSFVFFLSIYTKIGSAIKQKLNNADHYLLWGFLIFFIFASVSKSKLPNYMLNVLPIIAVLTSQAWFENIKNSKKLRNTQQVIVTLLWVLLLVALFLFSKEGLVWKYAFIITAFLLSNYFTKHYDPEQKLLYRSLSSIVVTGVALNFFVLPILFGFQAQPKAAEVINQNNTTNINVFNYSKSQLKRLARLKDEIESDSLNTFDQTPVEKHFSYNYELMFYSDFPIEEIETEQELNEALQYKNIWIFTDEEGLEELTNRKEPIDTLFKFDHFSLKRTAKYFNHKKGESPFVPAYLIRTNTKTNN
jgi:4-amino-4-deoxy-L-arabinose transferase-like glycosyltransferase